MKSSFLFFSAVGLLMHNTLAETPNPPSEEELRSYPPAVTNQLIFSTGFEDPNAPEVKLLSPNIRYAKGEGNTGNCAIKLEGKEAYGKIILPAGKFPEGMKYRVRIYVRGNIHSTDDKKYGSYRFMSVHYVDNASKKELPYTSAVFPFTTYPRDPDDISHFKEFTFDFYGKEGTTPVIYLYIKYGPFDGTLWFDDLRVYQLGVDAHINTVEPYMRAFRNQEGKFRLYAEAPGITQTCMLVTLKKDGKQLREMVLSPDTDGFFRGDFGKNLPEGNLTLNAMLADVSGKKKLQETSFPMTVRPSSEKPPRGYVTFDSRGRTLVDGVPFLSLTLGCWDHHENKLRRHAEAGFNVLQISPVVLVHSKHPNHAAELRKQLDQIAELGMKVRFDLTHFYLHPDYCTYYGAGPEGVEKLILQIKDHPAILGYYLLDELTEKGWPQVIAIREVANRVDPYHPTYICTNLKSTVPKISATCDVIGFDFYPFLKKNETRITDDVDCVAANVKKAGLPFFAIPQGFSWGHIKAKNPEEYQNYIDPSENQMLANALLFALNGAGEFWFYDCPLNWIWLDRTKKLGDPEHNERMFQKLSNVAHAMKKLGPYLLGNTDMPEVKIENPGKAGLRAKLYRSDEGKHALVILGSQEGVITLPDLDKLKSEFGRTVNLGGGKYKYTAPEFACDILYQQ